MCYQIFSAEQASFVYALMGFDNIIKPNHDKFCHLFFSNTRKIKKFFSPQHNYCLLKDNLSFNHAILPLNQSFVTISIDGTGDRSCFVILFFTPPPTRQIGKFDTETKETTWWGEENCWPSEPVFVPRPNAESEDDGERLFFCRDSRADGTQWSSRGH